MAWNVSERLILGIWIANERSLDEHYQWNFHPQIQKMQNCYGTWINRNLFLKGKVTIYNSLMISLQQYLIANTSTPPRVFNEVKKLACSFLWDNKKNKVAYNLVIQAVSEGGLHLMDLQSRTNASLLSWIRRMINNHTCTLAESLRGLTKEQNIAIILASKHSFHTSVSKGSPFYGEVLRTWERYHNLPPQGEQEIRREMLWCNPRIGPGP